MEDGRIQRDLFFTDGNNNDEWICNQETITIDHETNKIFDSALDVIVADRGYSRCIGPFTVVTLLSIRKGENQLSHSSANQTGCVKIVRDAIERGFG